MNKIVREYAAALHGDFAGAALHGAGAAVRGPLRPDLLRDELLPEIFAATVKAHPGALCLISGEREMSYAEVDREATALARGLLRHGVRPGDVVGLWLQRGPNLLISQLAIARTGAAWLPFDGDAPVERIAACLKDCAARALVTSPYLVAKIASAAPCPILTTDHLTDANDQTEVDARALGATTAHAAYLIYTSGSTGAPKGIVITQANICHYLRAANEVYGLTQRDVMFQSASVAFDLSMEEIWLPWLVGAALFVVTPEALGETEKLPDVMREAGVTAIDTVPTLLGLLPRDVPSLRIIILGGEACPPGVAERWCKPGRRIFNSYGPTETTIVATIAEVRAGAPVTIGKPIPNYTCYVVDDALALARPGAGGELLIGGPGVARGYLNRDALTAEKFIANPFAHGGLDPVLYRSGDAVAFDANGDIVFRGRIDDQVKIRGFRVELGEIEARLAALPGVRQAAAVLRSVDGIDQLVAFIVGDCGGAPDARALRAALRTQLPAYMQPQRYEALAELPRLASGKVNRNLLKTLPPGAAADTQAQEAPASPTEALLLAAAQKILPPQTIPFEADFFLDLGGHSLLAARFVSVLRETPALAGVTLQDVYALRNLRALAAMLAASAASAAPPRQLDFAPPPLMRRFCCGLAQAAALPVILTLMTVQWLGVFVSYMLLTEEGTPVWAEVGYLILVYICLNIFTIVFGVAAKWLIIGRTRPGRYPLWGLYYYRWWLTGRILSLAHLKWFQASPLMRWYLRALGAEVGRGAMIGDIVPGAVDLISIGEGASLGAKVKLANASVEGNELVIGRIDIGAEAMIGASCVIEDDCVIGEAAELKDLTAIRAGGRVGAREIWDGSPARRVGRVDINALEPPAPCSKPRRIAQSLVYLAALLVVPPLALIPIIPAFYMFDTIDALLALDDGNQLLYLASIPLFAWPMAFLMIILTVLFVVALRWIIMPRRVREGVYSIHSWFYVRKWVLSFICDMTLDTLGSLYATLYMRGWYRLMGAKIGAGTEISSSFGGRYDLIELGEKCFIADEVVLGDEDIRRGWMTLKRVKTGKRVFIGNDAVIPPGCSIPDGALIGIKSKPPEGRPVQENETWFGSPPIKLPVRQRFDGTGATWTYEAPRWKVVLRAIFEGVNISLPSMLSITFATWAIEYFGPALLEGDLDLFGLQFVISAVAISFALSLSVVAIKWLTIGRYEPTTRPMWSFWAMRTEAVAVLHWGLSSTVLLEHLRGTPMLPWFFRLLGARFGKGVYLDTTDLTEFDCVSVGSFAAINDSSALQTHLYEDRVMKVGCVNVGAGVAVAAGSTILYDTRVGDYARLGPLTIVMKGENIPPRSEWAGAPSQLRAASQAHSA